MHLWVKKRTLEKLNFILKLSFKVKECLILSNLQIFYSFCNFISILLHKEIYSVMWFHCILGFCIFVNIFSCGIFHNHLYMCIVILKTSLLSFIWYLWNFLLRSNAFKKISQHKIIEILKINSGSQDIKKMNKY